MDLSVTPLLTDIHVSNVTNAFSVSKEWAYANFHENRCIFVAKMEEKQFISLNFGGRSPLKKQFWRRKKLYFDPLNTLSQSSSYILDHPEY